jgi:ribokinase
MDNIFVIGSTNTDMVVKTDQFPLPGETKLGGTFFMHAGGKGANQAVAAARLGGRVTFVTKLGDDIFGRQSVTGFKKENIRTDYVFIEQKLASGTALIIVNEEGENSIVVAPGANAKLLPADIDKISDFKEAAIILVQLEIPMETVVYTAKLAKANHQRLIINPAPAQVLDDELLNGLFLITPNETEASLLTDIHVEDETSASRAAGILLSKGVQQVIITLGKRGAYFQNNRSGFMMPAPIVKALDSTAAGDVFCGAITVALSEKMEWERAVSFAIKAASISVTRMGAQSSIPDREELGMG